MYRKCENNYCTGNLVRNNCYLKCVLLVQASLSAAELRFVLLELCHTFEKRNKTYNTEQDEVDAYCCLCLHCGCLCTM